jgi:hypothetical protein
MKEIFIKGMAVMKAFFRVVHKRKKEIDTPVTATN